MGAPRRALRGAGHGHDLAPAGARTRPVRREYKGSLERTLSAGRILLVEDEPGIRESIAECLETEGYTVETVSNGAEALDWLGREEAPGLLLLDLVMPVMNGAELVERLQADPRLRDLPVILTTAAMPTDRTPLPPVAAVLAKPFELDALLAVVARHCRRAV